MRFPALLNEGPKRELRPTFEVAQFTLDEAASAPIACITHRIMNRSIFGRLGRPPQTLHRARPPGTHAVLRKVFPLRRNLSALAALALASSLSFAAVGPASAATLPADYAGDGHADLVNLQLDLLTGSLANAYIGHSQVITDSNGGITDPEGNPVTAGARTHAVAATPTSRSPATARRSRPTQRSRTPPRRRTRLRARCSRSTSARWPTSPSSPVTSARATSPTPSAPRATSSVRRARTSRASPSPA
jgi:hypothetical protein